MYGIYLSLQSGFLSALPYFGAWLVSLVSGVVADILIERRLISITVVRKMFTLIGKKICLFISSFCVHICMLVPVYTCTGLLLFLNVCWHSAVCADFLSLQVLRKLKAFASVLFLFVQLFETFYCLWYKVETKFQRGWFHSVIFAAPHPIWEWPLSESAESPNTLANNW